KFGVRGYTEALRTELDIERCGVSATTIHPGGISTHIARNARIEVGEGEDPVDPDEAAEEFEKNTHTSPEKAAELILGAVAKNKRRALIGPDAHVFDAASRVSPRLGQWAIAKLAARRGRVVV
ncbi:MAG: acetoin dehydrogenase, partial [Ilumatobacteraceae bacterium]